MERGEVFVADVEIATRVLQVLMESDDDAGVVRERRELYPAKARLDVLVPGPDRVPGVPLAGVVGGVVRDPLLEQPPTVRDAALSDRSTAFPA